VKDADKYPTTIENIRVNVFFDKNKKTVEFDEVITLAQPMMFYEFNIDIESEWINKYLYINIDFLVNKKKYTNDNYYGSIPHNFKVFVSDKESFFPANWYVGDVHYHSEFTSDQVEFGAPLEMTKKIANVMGMDWFFVTDHSYDLDDFEDNYLLNDPCLTKWTKMKDECLSLSDDEIQIQYGEEVSIGNEKGQNVHLLILNNPNFVEGKGDSAEKWFRNKPDVLLSELPNATDKSALYIAAHPFEQIPLLQRLLLNRGNWTENDIVNNQIEYLQIINGQSFSENINLIDRYLKLLLTGKKLFIVAGNDAHGNFQFMKQIKTPFWKLMCRKQQTFGDYFTAFHYHENKPIEGLKHKRIIISNGVFIDMSIDYKGCTYHIGDTVPADKLLIKYEYIIEEEHGDIKELKLIIGSITKQQIRYEKLDYERQDINFVVEDDSYVVLLLKTNKGYMALTNPIWVDTK